MGVGPALRDQAEDRRKWKKRGSVADVPTGPKDAKSTVLSAEEEAIIVALRRHTLLPIDDRLYACRQQSRISRMSAGQDVP